MEEKEIRRLAIDIFKEKVFTSDMFNSQEECERMLPSVFMPFIFINKDDEFFTKIKEAKDVIVYEYYDKAAPRSVNGLPIFSSFCILLNEECELLRKFVADIYSSLTVE
jgi:hypothetical protein